MERFDRILLDVWREACRHIEIGESAVTIGSMLAEHMPMRQLVVQRLDPDHQRLALAAVAPKLPEVDWPGVQALDNKDLRRLKSWARRGEIVRVGGPHHMPQPLESVRWPNTPGELLVAPLTAGQTPIGLLILVASPGKSFLAKHEPMTAALQEPLAVALDNDHRLRELAALREAAEADRRSLLNRLGRRELGDTIIGQRSGLQQVMQRVELIGRSDVPVLILGETGTGKELIARAIHQGSDRHAGPFIRVNCGAIPPELIDSQLFGHEKGSFTGAVESREGWFERADGGTLLLDEIGELPHDAQVRFLRVLQDGFVERVGGKQPIHVDVRVVAATHRDLAAMVREHRFREDLWYRIAVFPILLPPLRERREDIPSLVQHMAERAAIRFSLAPVTPKPEDIELLQAYHWPGNIRELGAVIDRAAILGDGKTLEIAAALGLGGPNSTRSSQSVTSPPGLAPAGKAAPVLTLDEAMRRHIETALRSVQGRIEGCRGAAALLKINPHTLRARMRKLGIDWSSFRQEEA
jgi:hydrogenase-4 transcriptional activator